MADAECFSRVMDAIAGVQAAPQVPRLDVGFATRCLTVKENVEPRSSLAFRRRLEYWQQQHYPDGEQQREETFARQLAGTVNYVHPPYVLGRGSSFLNLVYEAIGKQPLGARPQGGLNEWDLPAGNVLLTAAGLKHLQATPSDDPLWQLFDATTRLELWREGLLGRFIVANVMTETVLTPEARWLEKTGLPRLLGYVLSTHTTLGVLGKSPYGHEEAIGVYAVSVIALFEDE